jgi:hypothetical protein
LRARDIYDRIARIQADRKLGRQVQRMEAYLQSLPARDEADERPVLFFNASTRIHRLSINAAFSLLASWGLRQAGFPVLYAVCQRGMVQCILGTNREDYASLPPCKHCIPFSDRLYPPELVIPLTLNSELITRVDQELQDQSLRELIGWKYKEIPVGELCIPGLRWALRRQNLPDEGGIKDLFRKYLCSASNLAERFEELLKNKRPRSLVVFNGISYPEAIARYVAQERGIPVITHEVGLRPYSAFFTYKEATFRDVDLPKEGSLSQEEEDRLTSYLEGRFKGKFSMAGIQFWPEITDIPEKLQKKMNQYQQLVPVFTNVIFDTSQIHANTIFEDMFVWLDDLESKIKEHPETLFILRAHPDEDRPGKESRESVMAWYVKSQVRDLANVLFFPPSESISSYELIRRAKVVLVYNSSIGLEASIMGAPVLCAGRARYTQLPTTFFPESRQDYLDQLEDLLNAEHIELPPEFTLNARRFLHYELYRSSLDLSEFLRPYPQQAGMTLFNDFDPPELEQSPAIQVIRDGILNKEPFVYPNVLEE